jgi:hypothetical protein
MMRRSRASAAASVPDDLASSRPSRSKSARNVSARVGRFAFAGAFAAARFAGAFFAVTAYPPGHHPYPQGYPDTPLGRPGTGRGIGPETGDTQTKERALLWWWRGLENRPAPGSRWFVILRVAWVVCACCHQVQGVALVVVVRLRMAAPCRSWQGLQAGR